MTVARRVGRVAVAIALSAAATVLGAARPASAQPTHVAIVVDYQGQTWFDCVPYVSGMSGTQVLTHQFTVTYGRTGLITRIDGMGSDNPVTTYWAYWQDATGTWQYAQQGPLSTSPAPGSVEGWIFNDGKTPPPAVSYASICAGQDPVAPPPAPPPPVSTVAPGRTSAAPPAAGRSSTSVAPSPTPGASGPVTAPPSTTARNGVDPAVTSGDAGASPVARTLPGAAPVRRPPISAVPTWGTAIAGVTILALAGGGFWRTRVRRR